MQCEWGVSGAGADSGGKPPDKEIQARIAGGLS